MNPIEEKLSNLGARVREGASKVHPVTTAQKAAVSRTIDEQWSINQRAKSASIVAQEQKKIAAAIHDAAPQKKQSKVQTHTSLTKPKGPQHGH